jgi:flagellar hook-basal body complex protein FliE
VNAIEAAAFLPPRVPLAPLDVPDALLPRASAGGDFAAWMAREVTDTNARVLEAERQVQRLAAGDTSNLHQVMLRIEEARLHFQLFTQVRNRLLEGYQDVLRMQI